MLTTPLLKAFIEGFFGYGNLGARLWFVGMEEGGGSTEKEVQARLDTWAARGKPVVDDIAAFHRDFGQPKWFSASAPTQRTWRPIIRSILLAQDKAHDVEAIRSYQINHFARTTGEAASLELMPLPSPSTREADWKYRGWSELPELSRRGTYLTQAMPGRIARLQALLREHQPRVVVFYGTSYQSHWEAISGCTFGYGDFPRQACNGLSTFMVLPHPTAGPSGNPRTPGAVHFVAAGQALKALLA